MILPAFSHKAVGWTNDAASQWKGTSQAMFEKKHRANSNSRLVWMVISTLIDIFPIELQLYPTFIYIIVYTYIHYTTLHYITLHYIASHYVTLHYITLHYITLHYIASRYVTLHYITLHYITLHTITYHTYHTYHTIIYHTYIHIDDNVIQWCMHIYNTLKYKQGPLREILEPQKGF